MSATHFAAALSLFAVVPLGAQGLGRNDSTFTWTKAVAQGSLLTIRNGNGPITVGEAMSDRVEVRATKIHRGRGSLRDIGFDIRETGGGVEVCTLYGSQAACGQRTDARDIRVQVHYMVFVPRSTRLKVTTGNGEVSIERTGAEVIAETGNGRVTVGETEGQVNVSTGNGDVSVDGANGPVTVSTGNGRVDVATARGAVNASTGNGDIDVKIRALTVASDMQFSSGSGSIRVVLPANYNGQIDASTGNGNLHSDFEISIVGRLDSRHVRGSIGRGGPLMRLSTGNGSIELRKN